MDGKTKWGHLFDENINGRHINACMIKCTYNVHVKNDSTKIFNIALQYEKINEQISNQYQED